MNYWDSVGRWINTLLVFIVGILAFDALFRLLEANEDNVIVSFVRVLSVVFLVPFQGMFGEQDYLLTTLVGVLGYALLAGIALGVLRSLQASLAQPAPPVAPDASAQPQALPESTASTKTQAAARETREPTAPDESTPTSSEDSPNRRFLPGRAGREGRRPRTSPSAAPAATHERQESRTGNGATPDARTTPRDPRDQPERRRSRDRSRDRAASRRPASPTASSDKRA